MTRPSTSIAHDMEATSREGLGRHAHNRARLVDAGDRTAGWVMGAMTGLVPGIGDLVLLGTPAGVQVDVPVWFRVVGIRPSISIPGWVYLTGWRVPADGETELPPPERLFLRIAGLVVRRDGGTNE